jgi:hypothetical protein
MKRRYAIAWSVMAGIALGAAADRALQAQSLRRGGD